MMVKNSEWFSVYLNNLEEDIINTLMIGVDSCGLFAEHVDRMRSNLIKYVLNKVTDNDTALDILHNTNNVDMAYVLENYIIRKIKG